MRVFEERVCERVVDSKVVTTPEKTCGVVAHSLVDPGRRWPRSSHGEEATLCCHKRLVAVMRALQLKKRLTEKHVSP